MMPFTCGRTSAMTRGTTRPFNSWVRVTSSVFKVTTPTLGRGMPGAPVPSAAAAWRTAAKTANAAGNNVADRMKTIFLIIASFLLWSEKKTRSLQSSRAAEKNTPPPQHPPDGAQALSRVMHYNCPTVARQAFPPHERPAHRPQIVISPPQEGPTHPDRRHPPTGTDLSADGQAKS